MKKSQKNKRIFLDHASTTPVLPKVFLAMKPYLSSEFANPSALYAEGVAIRRVVAKARTTIAKTISAQSDEIIFTGSGTEADNLAIFGIVRALKGIVKNPHIAVSALEHPAILEAVEVLKKEGVEVTVLYPNQDGIIRPGDVFKALKKNTVLVSIMYANNEIGTIEPIHDIAKAIRQFRKSKTKESYLPYFHTDASQAANYLPIGVPQLGVDMMTLDASKIYGPKGIGMLFVRRGITLTPMIFGGGQERGLRSGTENVASIVGLAEALTSAQSGRVKESKRISTLRDWFVKEILKKFPEAHINGGMEYRLPNNINICFPGIDGEFAVILFDAEGIAISSSSSCQTLKDSSRSYVIDSLGKKDDCAESSLRITLGRGTTKNNLVYALRVFKKIASYVS